MLMTSLNEIKSFNPCTSGWEAILLGQSKKTSDEVLFPLVDAVNSNSILDVCWLIGKRRKELQILVKFAEMCSSDAANYAGDDVADADRYANLAAHATSNANYAHNDRDAAAHASYAAHYANLASAAANYYAASIIGREKQNQKNKQNLIQCINEFKA